MTSDAMETKAGATVLSLDVERARRASLKPDGSDRRTNYCDQISMALENYQRLGARAEALRLELAQMELRIEQALRR